MDEAILQATIELLVEAGLEGTTIRAVVERSGVARATVYLRWANRDALIGAALRRAIGREPYPLSGDLETDIRRGGEQARAIYGRPEFVAILPLLIRALLTGPDDPARPITYDRIAPNRRLFADEYRRLAAESGFRTDLDADLAADLLSGAHLNRLLATGRAPSREVSEQIVEVIIAGLRARS
jgi:AcrR family transcriptional regulator